MTREAEDTVKYAAGADRSRSREPLEFSVDAGVAAVAEVVRLRLLLILGVMAAIMLPALLVIVSLTPIYDSVASIEVSAEREDAVDLRQAATTRIPFETLISSEIKLITSRAVTGEVVERLDLLGDPEFNPYAEDESAGGLGLGALFGALQALFASNEEGEASSTDGVEVEREETIRNLLGAVRVRREGISLVINITASTEDPVKSARLANTFAEAYLSVRLANRIEEQTRASTLLDDRLRVLRERLQRTEAQIAEFRRENQLFQIAGQSFAEKQFDELSQELLSAEGALVDAETRLARAESLAGEEEEANTEALAALEDVQSSRTILELRAQRAEIIQRKAELSRRYGPRHPTLVAAQSNLDDIDAEIRSETSRVIESLTSEAAIAAQRVEALKDRIDQLQTEQAEKLDASIKLAEMERQAEADRRAYNNVLDLWNRTKEAAEFELSSSRIIGNASPPVDPARPNRRILAAATLAVAGLVGLGAAFLAEALDNTFSSADQVKRALGGRVYGIFPTLPGHGSARDQKRLARLDIRYFEALRHVLNNMVDPSPERGRIAAVFSALPKEGKSTFVTALASVAAASGMKSVIVDLDLRRQSLSRDCKLANISGLADYIAGKVHLEEIQYSHFQDSFISVVPAGKNAARVDLVREQSRLKAMLDRLAGMYDLVLIDTPPILAVDDFRAIAPNVQTSLFALRWRSTPRYSAITGYESLENEVAESGGELGIVLTRVDVQSRAFARERRHGRFFSRKFDDYYRVREAAPPEADDAGSASA